MVQSMRDWNRSLDREIRSIDREVQKAGGFALWSNSWRVRGLEMEMEDHRGEEAAKKEKSGEFLVAPVPFRNPQLGWGLALGIAYLHRYDKTDHVSPPSTIGVAGMYTENDSAGAFLFYRGYLAQDTWRVVVAGGRVRVNYDFFGIGDDAGDNGISIPLQTRFDLVRVELLRRIAGDVFLGGIAQYGRTASSLRANIPILPPEINKAELKINTNALGFRTLWDTRNDTFYPTDGQLLDFSGLFFDQAWNATYDYQVFEFAYNQYIEIDDASVLAYRIYGKATAGDVPFFALAQFGTKSDIRGYIPGRYRDQLMYAVQMEYRRKIWKRLGAAVFVGIGEIAPSVDRFFDNFLPAVGAGLRYQLTSKTPINYRIDVAVGINEVVFYFAVGEAF